MGQFSLSGESAKNNRQIIRSHVLQLIESCLHLVDLIALSGAWLSRGCDTALPSGNLTTSFHSLLVPHLVQKLHHLTVVDRCRVDVVQSSIHVSCLDIHVLKDCLEGADTASHTE